MSHTLRLAAVTVVALVGASVAPAQNTRGVRQSPVVAPLPAMFMQQELNYRNAVREAQLWQMYQPPVVILNNPWVNTYNTNVWQPGVNYGNQWTPSYNTPGALWGSSNTFYRNTAPTWGNTPGLYRPFR